MKELSMDERIYLENALTDLIDDELLVEIATNLQIDMSPKTIQDWSRSPCDVCLDCVSARGEWFMVHNHVWEEARGERYLCVRCMETRLGRELTPADFTDAPVNIPDKSTLLLTRLGFCR